MSVDDYVGNWKHILGKSSSVDIVSTKIADKVLEARATSLNDSSMTFTTNGETIASIPLMNWIQYTGKYNKISGEITWDDGTRWKRQGTTRNYICT